MKLAEKKLDGHELTEQNYEKAMKEHLGRTTLVASWNGPNNYRIKIFW
jgi:hypothetical protein